MSALGRRMADYALPPGVDRATVTALTAGHVGSDLFQGAVPALVVFWVAERAWSYSDAGLLVLAGSLASSLLQPLAGALGDRVRSAWLVPAGLVLASAGLAGAGVLASFPLAFAALVVGGLGVALFHPEAVRAVTAASGPHAGAAVGLFAVGGSAGFALGPALTAPAVLLWGLEGMVGVALVPLLAAAWIVVVGRRPAVVVAQAGAGGGADRPSHPVRFAAAAVAATLRSGFMFGLMAFVPVWFAADLGLGAGAGNAAVTAMLVAGAVGTYVGARVGDRIGYPLVAVGSLAIVVPLAAVLPFLGASAWPVAVLLLLVIGMMMDANFYPLVLIAQDALPGRVGLSTGVTIGLSVGIGAALTSVLGAITDDRGPTTAMHAATVLAIAAFVVALPLSGRRPWRRAETATTSPAA
ncbi:MAG: transporter, family, fosmidomycin resistance protein [Gaiellaceae bacterium]|nr:transporter, family, fosmidomycin resistance protein [Gaiellaceae bacterium]